MKLEAIGHLDKIYLTNLNFIWQAMQKAGQEAPSDCSGSFSSLVLPTLNYLLNLNAFFYNKLQIDCKTHVCMYQCYIGLIP